ncbi:MAG TPA: PQQ-dependent sugar dehydrogenase [Lysobacter sp.]|nr:PQQ-dependent sugar dehydrogenase [Lysobacter sp.]
MRIVWTMMLLLSLLCIGGCRGDASTSVPTSPPRAADSPPVEVASRQGSFTLTELVTGLDHPWALAFLPDGGMLVTERPGRLRLIRNGEVSAPLGGLPKIFVDDGQAGLLDVALSPDFAKDRLVYLAYAEPNFRGNKTGTAVLRGRLGNDALESVEVIYRQEPKLSSGTHVGTRIVFDDAGYLWVTQGEGRVAEAAQHLDKLQGKLVRIRPNGSVPQDNPFVGTKDSRPEIWSYGHRNMQGAALHPVTRKLWTTEHGPMGGDELNIPQARHNYGWPVITNGKDYSGEPVPGSIGASAPGMESPHYVWTVSPGLSGMAFYTADLLPQWKGNLFLGALATHELIRLELDGDKIVGEERLLTDRNQRIRDVRQGPDGALYLLVDADAPDGKLLRIGPVDAAAAGMQK